EEKGYIPHQDYLSLSLLNLTHFGHLDGYVGQAKGFWGNFGFGFQESFAIGYTYARALDVRNVDVSLRRGANRYIQSVLSNELIGQLPGNKKLFVIGEDVTDDEIKGYVRQFTGPNQPVHRLIDQVLQGLPNEEESLNDTENPEGLFLNFDRFASDSSIRIHFDGFDKGSGLRTQRCRLIDDTKLQDSSSSYQIPPWEPCEGRVEKTGLVDGHRYRMQFLLVDNSPNRNRSVYTQPFWFRVDQFPPRVVWTKAPQLSTTHSAHFRFKVSDAHSGLKSVQCQVRNLQTRFVSKRVDCLDGLNIEKLANGRYQIQVIAIDKKKNRRVASRNFTVNGPNATGNNGCPAGYRFDGENNRCFFHSDDSPQGSNSVGTER
ncbi:MAG: hypothetical protein AAF203_06475, partial [Pseudomonadota bacterium]